LNTIFTEHPNALLLGEDVLDPYGGAFKVTAGLSTKFPDRVLTTPISEAAITGLGAGLALRGYIPIVEIMFSDFLTLCADQIVNHASKFPLMYPNTHCPLILRTPIGGGRGYGPTHSQSLEKMFMGIPGLKILAPSVFHNPGETLRKVVIKEKGPVLFLEHKLLYSEKIQVNTSNIQLETLSAQDGYGVAVVRNYHQGNPDVCLIGYGGFSRDVSSLLLELAAEEIRVVVAIPECIDPPPIEILVRLASEAKRVVIVDEANEGFNWSTGVAALMYEKLWGVLEAPIKIVSSEREAIPTSQALELGMLLNKTKIEAALLETISWA
jgi:pyruvate/2-oxoglutarate/acetoin dehydrogenase E1 component